MSSLNRHLLAYSAGAPLLGSALPKKAQTQQRRQAPKLVMAFAIATLAFGQGNPPDHAADLFNYAIFMRVAMMDQAAPKAVAQVHNPKPSRDYAKQQTGLDDAQQAILVR